MQLVEWNPAFETGLDVIDGQHRRLFKITNRLSELLSNNQAENQAVEMTLAEVLHYTQYHFEEEEQVMADMKVDPAHVDLHHLQHQTFFRDIQLLRGDLPSEGGNGKMLLEFLMSWLVYHILGLDSSMGKQIALIRQGVSAREACLQESRRSDDATGMLLTSLNKLFHQVSQRNRQLSDLNLSLEQKVAERTRELSEANQRLSELACTDVLTGLANRRHAMQQLECLWAEAQGGKPLSCMMLDADGFKQVNDRFGHETGDLVLRQLARQLQHLVRTDDIVCRLGGDEFLILLPGTDAIGAAQIAAQVHAGVGAMRIEFPGGSWPGSISAGVATLAADMAESSDLIRAADQAVYAAKQAGKNCVRIAPATVQPSLGDGHLNPDISPCQQIGRC